MENIYATRYVYGNLDFIKHIEISLKGFNWFMIEVLIEIKMTYKFLPRVLIGL